MLMLRNTEMITDNIYKSLLKFYIMFIYNIIVCIIKKLNYFNMWYIVLCIVLQLTRFTSVLFIERQITATVALMC